MERALSSPDCVGHALAIHGPCGAFISPPREGSNNFGGTSPTMQIRACVEMDIRLSSEI